MASMMVLNTEGGHSSFLSARPQPLTGYRDTTHTVVFYVHIMHMCVPKYVRVIWITLHAKASFNIGLE